MFDVLIESDPNRKPKKTALSLAISVVLHGVILVLAIILPLFFTETLSPALVVTYLAAPPPPRRLLHHRLPQRRRRLPRP